MAKTVALLTASWCPRCPVARRLWAGLRDRLGFDLRELDIDSREGQDAAALWKISSVPAVIVDGELAGNVFDEARAQEILISGIPTAAPGGGFRQGQNQKF